MLVILSRSDPCLQILHDLFYPFHNLQGEDSTCLAPICFAATALPARAAPGALAMRQPAIVPRPMGQTRARRRNVCSTKSEHVLEQKALSWLQDLFLFTATVFVRRLTQG